MAHPHKPCDSISFNDEFYDNNGITNGADWYSVKGGMISVFVKMAFSLELCRLDLCVEPENLWRGSWSRFLQTGCPSAESPVSGC